MNRGTNGVLLKLCRADDYKLQVTNTKHLTRHYVRIEFTSAGLLTNHPPYPTQYIRLWIPDPESDTAHHRPFTLIDQDPDNDRFAIEFAIHTGPASQWAARAVVGDVVEATMYGPRFALPETPPSTYFVFGDITSLPAINSLLDAIGDTPAQVWLEWTHESDRTLPVRRREQHTVTWLQRVDSGRLLREKAAETSVPSDAFVWVACDGPTTRSIVKTLKNTHGLPKNSMKYQAYWK